MLHHSRLAEEAAIAAAFAHFDADGDGAITRAELAAVLAADGDEIGSRRSDGGEGAGGEGGDGGCAPAEAAAAAMIRAVDGDGDGAIGWKEVRSVLF